MTDELVLRLNPALDPERYVADFARDGYVQIFDLFEPDVVEYFTEVLERAMQWDLVYLEEQLRGVNLTRAQQQALGPQKMQEILTGLRDRSGSSLGLIYLGYAMITARRDNRDPGHPIHHLTDFICSPAFLEFGAKIIGRSDVRRADAQATLYRPGDFIGLHDDTGWETGTRLAAYTLGFTRQWRSDWGGQLLMHDDRGDVSRGFVPRWNALTLFNVPRLHSVAPVAPYARRPRISVVGWLRDDSPAPAG